MAKKNDDEKGIFDRIGDILRSPLPGTGNDDDVKKDEDVKAEAKSRKSAGKPAAKASGDAERSTAKRPTKMPQATKSRKEQVARRSARTENKVRQTEIDEEKAKGSVYGRAGARQQKSANQTKEQQPTSAAPEPTAAPAAAPEAAPTPAPAPAPAPAAPRTYTVVSGDTLGHIAQRYYGNAAQWPKIFEANRDKISDPDLIRVGQVLVIPE